MYSEHLMALSRLSAEITTIADSHRKHLESQDKTLLENNAKIFELESKIKEFESASVIECTEVIEEPMTAKEFIEKHLNDSWGTKSLYKYLRAYRMIDEKNVPHEGNIIAGNMVYFKNRTIGIFPKMAEALVSFIEADKIVVLDKDTRPVLDKLHDKIYSGGQGAKQHG